MICVSVFKLTLKLTQDPVGISNTDRAQLGAKLIQLIYFGFLAGQMSAVCELMTRGDIALLQLALGKNGRLRSLHLLGWRATFSKKGGKRI